MVGKPTDILSVCHSWSWICFSFHAAVASLISLAAPTKLVPLSEWIVLGVARLLMNLLSMLMKQSVSKDEANSRCTAGEFRQVNKMPHRLMTALPHFAFKGPKRSTPVCVKQGSKAVVRNVGNSTIICSILAALCFLHFRHNCTTLRTKDLPLQSKTSLSVEPECDFDLHGLVSDGMMQSEAG